MRIVEGDEDDDDSDALPARPLFEQRTTLASRDQHTRRIRVNQAKSIFKFKLVLPS